MKILHNETPDYSDIDILDGIVKSIYAINENINEYYNIHVNFVNNFYIIACEPLKAIFPIIKLSTYISKSGDNETLHINPKSISKFPSSLNFSNYDKCLDIVNSYIDIMDFILALYDYEYEL